MRARHLNVLLRTLVAAAVLTSVSAGAATDFSATFRAAAAYVNVGNYGPAMREYLKIIYQTDDPDTRDHARLELARCYGFAYDITKAQNELRGLSEEGSGEWAAAARLELAKLHITESKFAAAMAELTQLITDQPRSRHANEAHFLIGRRLFDLGRFEEAAERLERVGTACPPADRARISLEPGEPVFVQLVDADLYIAAEDEGVEVEVTTQRGEKETLMLKPLSGSPDVLAAALPTRLGDPIPTNGILEVSGADTVSVAYTDAIAADGKKGILRQGTIGVAAAASLWLLSESGAHEVSFALLDTPSRIRLRDPDRDMTSGPDTIEVIASSPRTPVARIALTETGDHTGIFEGTLVAGLSANSGKALVARPGDRVEVFYTDNRRPGFGDPQRKLTVSVEVVQSTQGTVRSLGAPIAPDELERMTAMERGKSYFIIGKAHDHIGLRDDALASFDDALAEFAYVLRYAPAGSEAAAEALRMSWKIYLEQGNYNAALTTCVRLIKHHAEPESAVTTLFELATELEAKEPRQATLYYNKLVQEFPQSPVAAEAQYRLAVSAKQQARRNPRMKETCVREFHSLVELFPHSEHVPEALSFIAEFYQDSGDYERALDFSRRLASSYAASSYVEEGVIAQGKALQKMGEHKQALTIFKKVAFDNPDAAGELEPLIQECEDALDPQAATTEPGEGANP